MQIRQAVRESVRSIAGLAVLYLRRARLCPLYSTERREAFNAFYALRTAAQIAALPLKA